jgi:hypothetical protein
MIKRRDTAPRLSTECGTWVMLGEPSAQRFVTHVCVDLGSADTAVAEQMLHVANVEALLK